MKPQPLTILFVEDEQCDRQLFAKAFKKTGINAVAKFVENGFQMKEYLLGEGKFSNRHLYPSPNIIVTDFQMPGFDGFEVLQWVKTTRPFRSIPVVLLSAVLMQKDFMRARELGADMFLTKADGLRETVELFQVSFGPLLAETAQCEAA